MQIQNEIAKTLEQDVIEHLSDDELKNVVIGLISNVENESSLVDFAIAFSNLKTYLYCLRDVGFISYSLCDKWTDLAKQINLQYVSIAPIFE